MVFLKLDAWIIFRDFFYFLKESSACHFEDIALMDRHYALPVTPFCFLKCVFWDISTGRARDLPDSNKNIIRKLYFLSEIKPLCAFPYTNKINISQWFMGIGECFDRPDIGIKVKLLPYRNCNTSWRTCASGGRCWSFKTSIRIGKHIPCRFRDQRIPAIFFPPLFSPFTHYELNFCTGRLCYPEHAVYKFRSYAITFYYCCFLTHDPFIYLN